ncbi:hypothetical protein ABES02_21770 [Neobacillus pocheonensis]|uniref:hypothetical protein n=1 Tax=Neobacillus pocheonensis TaxID=363869 RepID=UPI003D2B5A49
MKIYEYYRDAANISLNGSIAALLPASLIVFGNISFINNQKIMLLTIPFFVYSFLSFQLYLFRREQSITIARNMSSTNNTVNSFFNANQLLVFFMNTQSPNLLFYFPNGYLAGSIEKYQRNVYVLYNCEKEAIGYFKVNGRKVVTVDVYSPCRSYLGCLEIKKLTWNKNKKELLDGAGRYLGAVEGSSIYMDEEVINKKNQQVGRLRRGWMPLEWSPLFPNPNTPVLSLQGLKSERDKLLGLSFLIHEFFVER